MEMTQSMTQSARMKSAKSLEMKTKIQTLPMGALHRRHFHEEIDI
jgi:hypothetical protein